MDIHFSLYKHKKRTCTSKTALPDLCAALMAQKAMKKDRGVDLVWYRCNYCDKIHLGHPAPLYRKLWFWFYIRPIQLILLNGLKGRDLEGFKRIMKKRKEAGIYYVPFD